MSRPVISCIVYHLNIRKHAFKHMDWLDFIYSGRSCMLIDNFKKGKIQSISLCIKSKSNRSTAKGKGKDEEAGTRQRYKRQPKSRYSHHRQINKSKASANGNQPQDSWYSIAHGQFRTVTPLCNNYNSHSGSRSQIPHSIKQPPLHCYLRCVILDSFSFARFVLPMLAGILCMS